MHASRRRCSTFLLLALGASSAAQACGEGMFNTGKGLPYQVYLAPRPAAVLVYAAPDTASGQGEASIYAGLQKAGHHVTVVRDATTLKQAMSQKHYDVVISAFDDIDTVTAAESAQTPSLLPVVTRALRNTPEVKNRFDLFLLDGASLGQYMRAIDKLIKAP